MERDSLIKYMVAVVGEMLAHDQGIYGEGRSWSRRRSERTKILGLAVPGSQCR
jgi:hypothetical protein